MLQKHILALLMLSWGYVVAYPGGAPTSTCIYTFPKHHGSQQQDSPSPYIINLSPTNYKPGDTITVTLTSKDGQKPFIGFQVKAQAESGETEPLVGTFPKDSLPVDAKGSVWWPEDLDPNWASREPNCVTHSHNQPRTSVQLTWKAPDQNVGNIVFRAGIVENFSTFWVSDNKAVLTALDPFTPPVDFPTKVNTGYVSPPIELDDRTCGRTKGCMFYPTGCHGDDCMFAASFKVQGSQINFELTGITPGYLSLAFSFDTAMGKDLATTCVERDNIYSVQNGYNPALYYHQHPIQGLSNIYINRQGDRLSCRFTRNIADYTVDLQKTGEIKRIEYLLSNKWYIFLAYGDVYKGTDIPEKHRILPLISDRKVSLTDTDVVYAKSLHPTLRAHGSLGVLSWIAMIGMAVLIARFYKPILSNKLFGAASWFQVHRGLVLLALLMSAISVIIIFAYLKAWSEKATVHAVLGLIAVALGHVQVISGLLRPSPDHSKRAIFNWFHRSSGFIAFICAAVCVLLAFQVEVIGEPFRTQGTATVATWLAFYVTWFIVLQIMHCVRDRNANDVEHVSKNGLSIQEPPSKPSKGDMWKVVHMAWLIIGVMATLALSILMLYYINIA